MQRKRYHHRRSGVRRRIWSRIPWKIVGIAAGIIAAIVLIVLMAQPTATLVSSAEVATIRNRGILRVAVLEDMPGYCDDGAGFEAELAREVARRIFPDTEIDVSLDLVTVNEKTALPKLQNGDVDLVIAQIAADSESYAYSPVYASDPVRLLTLPGREKTVLQDCILGAVQQSAAEDVLSAGISQLGESVNVTCRSYPSYPDLFHALNRGEVVAAAVPASRLGRYLDGGWKLHDFCPGSIDYQAVTTSDNVPLTQLVGVILSDWERDGTLQELQEKYGIS